VRLSGCTPPPPQNHYRSVVASLPSCSMLNQTIHSPAYPLQKLLETVQRNERVTSW
jgi:hypothetical protein